MYNVFHQRRIGSLSTGKCIMMQCGATAMKVAGILVLLCSQCTAVNWTHSPNGGQGKCQDYHKPNTVVTFALEDPFPQFQTDDGKTCADHETEGACFQSTPPFLHLVSVQAGAGEAKCCTNPSS